MALTEHATIQEPWTGADRVPPHGAVFTFTVQDSPAGKLVVFTCSACGAKLGAILWGIPSSKLQPRWWVCRKCGLNKDVGLVVA